VGPLAGRQPCAPTPSSACSTHTQRRCDPWDWFWACCIAFCHAAVFLDTTCVLLAHPTCLHADLPTAVLSVAVLQLVFFLPQLVQLLRDDRGKLR
jgi:hypothetical protein